MQINDFQKRQDKVVCIDSDGTALDTMNIKHIKCFGPCFAHEWDLGVHTADALKRWNAINLFEKTRGKNRFITLLLILQEYNGKYLQEDLTSLENWVKSGKELSNKSLQKEIAETEAPILKKALKWSESVNAEIAKLTAEDKRPFEGAKEFLTYASGKADIAVVSSAGGEALLDEWARYGMDSLVDVMCSQEDGTKEQCLRLLMSKGYEPKNILMVGDSFPDIDAAEECGVLFYPILAGKEKESWQELLNRYFNLFMQGEYAAAESRKKKEYYRNLNAE